MRRDPIRTLLVDDHMMVRKGIISFLDLFDDIMVVGEADNGLEAVEKAERLAPDVILMDLMMPGMDGVEATRRIAAAMPKVRVLVLTSFCTDDLIFSALRAGAVGYLLKDSDPTNLVDSIRAAVRGESSLHPSVAQRVLQGFHDAGEREEEPDALTPRELEVLVLLAQGHTDREIAGRLSVSPVTIRTHVSNIIAKLHVANRVQATLYALRSGLVTTMGVAGSDLADAEHPGDAKTRG